MGESSVEIVEYPSQDFEKTIDSLVERHESFTVFVPEKSPKNKFVRDKLNKLSGRPHEYRSRLGSIVATFRIFDFFSALAIPLRGDGYNMRLEDNGDLTIYFIAK